MAENDLHSVAFPKLSEPQMASLGRCSLTKPRRFHAGENQKILPAKSSSKAPKGPAPLKS